MKRLKPLFENIFLVFGGVVLTCWFCWLAWISGLIPALIGIILGLLFLGVLYVVVTPVNYFLDGVYRKFFRGRVEIFVLAMFIVSAIVAAAVGWYILRGHL